MQASLKAELRSMEATKSELKAMRAGGRVPAVVYGKSIGSVPISVDEKQMSALLRGHHNGVLTLEVPGQGSQPVMVGGVDRHKLSRDVLHVDFHQINMSEPVLAKVPIDLEGDSPGVREGGVLTALLHEIEVRCLPDKLPADLKVDISALGTGDSLLAGDLSLPEGVELKTDPHAVIVTILIPQKAGDDRQDDEEETAGEGRAEAGLPEAAETT
ncbi:50S ribosomal protein L25 [Paenibacillus sp. HJGM_3]|uniref:50S ribosomal protein L25 n=1 Tax=Paenibacillus sp. HJGM_3 TaxID=3379816 RepID=UPI00385E3DB6